jgi:hypothetical protein
LQKSHRMNCPEMGQITPESHAFRGKPGVSGQRRPTCRVFESPAAW